ncbi:hypothetical protein EUX98_g9562 [Antrodiella citrinella]|uniref:Tc1-like transposase DDE domain-containing protein n=1 Tax=Antrodiella citrinella TaxID=2447956 RepID=A0A4S4LR09_9APHY|nr:hypothetical protein EUX98_g9562 [Antrodiella citrinella]
MVNRFISPDVKRAAIRLYERNLLPLEDILDCINISARTFWRILKLYRQTGDVINPRPRQRGRPRKLLSDDVQYLIRLIRHRPDWFLDELLGLLDNNRFVAVHFSTIHRELLRAGVSLKKLKRVAAERDELLRADFVRRMAVYTPEQLRFMDEVSKDERTLKRRNGRALKGRRAVMRGVFVRGRRVSGEGVMTVDGMVASTVVQGSMTRKRFLDFLEHEVLPLMTPFPGYFSVLVMDNARIHHGTRILELAELFGVRIVFLPPYSPDLNPIEEAFSKIKAWIQRNYDVFSSDDGIISDMLEAMNVITPEDAQGYIQHAGYL